MIAVDTNVLVRFLTQDDPLRSKAASKLFQASEAAGQKIRIDVLVLVETYWVLAKAYGVPAADLRELVAELLETSVLVFEDHNLIHQALAISKAHRQDLPDALIALRNAGCESTWTFDKKTAKLPGFKLLK